MNRPTARLIVLENLRGIAAYAASMIVDQARNAIDQRGRFAIALSGGSTPATLHTMLASDRVRNTIDWSNVVVFWGDERFVPHTDSQSNFRVARETLLSKVPIPEANLYPIHTEGTPEHAAEVYAQTLMTVLGPEARLDLIVLGMGEDGHTASLFPGQRDTSETKARLVKAIHASPKPPPVRVTLDLSCINQARQVIFLVSGSGKHDALTAVFDNRTPIDLIPAKGVAPQSGDLVWLVDREAYDPISL